jgi:group I intron endonuclease
MGRNGTFTIYAHINPLTGMAYVGQTSLHPYLRWDGGTAYRKNKTLFKEFKEIGWNNFKHPILEDNILTKEKADEFEKYFIKKYSNENGVYNIDEGGSRGDKSYKDNKRIPVYQIDNNLNIIAEFDSITEATSKILYDLEDAGKDISHYLNNSGAGRLIGNCIMHKINSVFGYHWCKKSDYKPDWKPVPPKQKKIFQYDLNGNFIKEWVSLSEASRELNINRSSIVLCKGQRKTAGGFIWKSEKNSSLFKNLEPNKTTAKKIMQYDLQGSFIKEWESITQASKELNISNEIICKVCKGGGKTAGGFIWKYAEEQK